MGPTALRLTSPCTPLSTALYCIALLYCTVLYCIATSAVHYIVVQCSASVQCSTLYTVIHLLCFIGALACERGDSNVALLHLAKIHCTLHFHHYSAVPYSALACSSAQGMQIEIRCSAVAGKSVQQLQNNEQINTQLVCWQTI